MYLNRDIVSLKEIKICGDFLYNKSKQLEKKYKTNCWELLEIVCNKIENDYIKKILWGYLLTKDVKDASERNEPINMRDVEVDTLKLWLIGLAIKLCKEEDYLNIKIDGELYNNILREVHSLQIITEEDKIYVEGILESMRGKTIKELLEEIR